MLINKVYRDQVEQFHIKTSEQKNMVDRLVDYNLYLYSLLIDRKIKRYVFKVLDEIRQL